jgi:class 3 adenylate cyclase
MPSLSFRTKLILAMSIIVLGVTSATIMVTQERVQATYQRLFEAQFRMAIDVFSERQRARLDSICNQCKAVTKSVRLIAALNANDPARVYDDLTQTFRDTGRTGTHGSEDIGALLSALAPVRKGSGPGGGLPREAETAFIRVLNPQGDPLPTKDPRFGAGRRSASAQKLIEQLRQMMARVNEGGLKEQQVGYLAIELEKGPVQLREFIITPIIDPAEQRTLGALVIGLPLSDLGEKEMYNSSRKTEDGVLLSGIWIGGQLHTKTIPNGVREMIGHQIGRAIGRGMRLSEDVTAYVNGVEHRVVFKVLNPDSPLPPACQVGLYSLASVRAEQRDLRLRIIGFGVLALGGALALILFISHGLTVPINDLVRGTAEVREGNYEVRVPVRSRDEIGQLTTSFNEMAAGLALSRRYQSVLAQVADKEVAEALMRGEGGLGGEAREVSVLFCDIRGFSALTQLLPPAEVIALLNEHMTALTAVVYEHNGVVDKFVGDLIMAVFGAPKSCGNDAHNAARCAIRMIIERDRLNHAGPLKIAVGIGVATGEVIAGCMGSKDRLNYTVLGQRVNLAARLCAQAGRMEVFIDDATREKLGELVVVEAVPDLLLKGFTHPVSAFKLKEVRSLSRLA